jgi:flagellar biosynthesis chaperone FliJ
MTPEELKNKAEEYKIKLERLTTERQNVERQLIILEEQYKQYKEKINLAFGTTEPEKLHDIAVQYLNDIEQLEAQLQS